jgi:hypothetical protein
MSLRTPHLRRLLVVAATGALAAVVACGGSIDASPSGDTTDPQSNPCPANPPGGACQEPQPPGTSKPPVVTQRVPAVHRSTATPCDSIRPTTEPTNIPDGGAGGWIECRSNAECTQGVNGRCNGNGHDGWHCTYDQCTDDSQCKGGGVCQCEGGFRADNNVCLTSSCRVDADCGPGRYCSPSLGDCGSYGGVAGYFCHEPADECVDDSDCASSGSIKGTCRYNQTVGHWKCSTSECAG